MESKDDEYKEIDQITEKIFLGNMDAAWDKELLKSYKITHVLVCAKHLDQHHPDDFIYKQFHIMDAPSENILQYFDSANEFIESAGKVFVHCMAGVSRSASFVIAYLMWKEKFEFNTAYQLVKSKRHIIYPNVGFVRQLKTFETYLKSKDSFIKDNSSSNKKNKKKKIKERLKSNSDSESNSQYNEIESNIITMSNSGFNEN
jgi:protein-tyrosine phosphatase